MAPDADGKVHAPLRQLASKCHAFLRYRNGSVRPAMYFMPKEDRSLQNFPSPSSSTGIRKPSSDSNGLDGFLKVSSDELETPVTFSGSNGNLESDYYDRAGESWKPSGNPEIADQHCELSTPGPKFPRSEKKSCSTAACLR